VMDQDLRHFIHQVLEDAWAGGSIHV
jgi:hypothetical protein